MPGKVRTLAILIVVSAVPVLAEKFWESKDFTAWTEKECMEILRKSPWAFSNTFGRKQSVMLTAQTGVEILDPSTPRGQAATGSQPTWGEAERNEVIEFQILSAKPVRMALARLQMIRRPDDAALKEQAAKFVNQQFEKQVVIQISYRSTPPGSQAVSDIHTFFLNATLSDFRTDTRLITDKNRHVPIEEYWRPGPNRSNAAFVFPRFDDRGEPNFTGNDKSITLRSKFAPKIRDKAQPFDIFVKMNPKEMHFRKEFAF